MENEAEQENEVKEEKRGRKRKNEEEEKETTDFDNIENPKAPEGSSTELKPHNNKSPPTLNLPECPGGSSIVLNPPK